MISYIAYRLRVSVVSGIGLNYHVCIDLHSFGYLGIAVARDRGDSILPRRLSPSLKDDPLFTLRYYEVVKSPESVNRSVGLKTVPKAHRKAGAGIRLSKKKTLSHVHRKIEAGDHVFETKDDSSQSYFVYRRNASSWSRKGKGGGANKEAVWDGQ